jgi:hypothetical protein
MGGFEAGNAPTPFRASSPRELLFYQHILAKLSMGPIDIQHMGAAVYLGILESSGDALRR